ncbi:MAG TPA: redoxin domain-containing protein [Candidatus Limnocylindria bacterium]|nr:redoxin domain-containing protein [Candidatus Limnocylindria bacterium]
MGTQRNAVGWALALAAACALGAVASATEAHSVPNFRLLDHQGHSFELHRLKERKAVVLMVTENGCPIVRHTLVELKALRTKFAARGVEFALLDPNLEDTAASVAKEVQDYNIDLPVLLDRDQLVARQLGVVRTAEVYVLDPKNWTVVYHGPVDDRLDYGQQKPAANHAYLSDALEAVTNGGQPAIASAPVKGCAIAYDGPFAKAASPVSYASDISPLLTQHCEICHRPGGGAPFAFDGYSRVKAKASTIMEALLERRMPPWQPNPDHGCFSNANELSPREKQLFAAWVEQGSPRGEGIDPLASKPAESPLDWPLGTPDLVVKMARKVDLPATGLVPYQYQQVSAPTTEDAWVRGAVIRAGNAKVLHHCLVFVKYPVALKDQEPKQEAGSAGFFAGYVPGSRHTFFPEGTGKFIPRGSKFIFQMHYTTTGKPESDLSEMGLYVLPARPAREIITGAANNMDFTLPPRSVDTPIRADFVFAKASTLYDFSPHMHLRGYNFNYTAEYPDGRREVLLDVPRYDFNWQFQYRLKEPKRIPAGTRLVCRATYDNSSLNPANPDPNATVHVGENTTDEMFIGYFNYSEGANETVSASVATPARN